jgi:AraC-like DNA-binding protein
MLGALEPGSGDSSPSRRRLARALVELEAQLADPELTAATLAAQQGISRRRLDAIFAEHGLSVQSLIWERRLVRVAAELGAESKRALRLIDIAQAWGFNSEAHFSRAFRRRFGQSPSAYRRGASPY